MGVEEQGPSSAPLVFIASANLRSLSHRTHQKLPAHGGKLPVLIFTQTRFTGSNLHNTHSVFNITQQSTEIKLRNILHELGEIALLSRFVSALWLMRSKIKVYLWHYSSHKMKTCHFILTFMLLQTHML